jgi:hypothetical protein
MNWMITLAIPYGSIAPYFSEVVATNVCIALHSRFSYEIVEDAVCSVCQEPEEKERSKASANAVVAEYIG